MYIEDIIGYLILAVVTSIVIFCGYFFIQKSKEPTFSLIKSEWTCTKSHLVTTHVLINKVLMPQIRSVCDQWTRIQTQVAGYVYKLNGEAIRRFKRHI